MKFGRGGIWLVLLSITGCSWIGYTARNIISTPIDLADECNLQHQLHQAARVAWAEECGSESNRYSRAFKKGFEAGFVDFVEHNATGEPPAIPPAHLVRAGMRSPDAQEDVLEWYAGFRRGASKARATGLRERLLVPIGLPPRTPVGASAPIEAFPPAPTPIVPSDTRTSR